MLAIFSLGTGAATVATGFARMSRELAASLAAIGLLAAIYHPVRTATLVADAARRARDRHRQRVGQSRSTDEFVLVFKCNTMVAVFLPKRRNPFMTISRKIRSLYLRLLHS